VISKGPKRQQEVHREVPTIWWNIIYVFTGWLLSERRFKRPCP